MGSKKEKNTFSGSEENQSTSNPIVLALLGILLVGGVFAGAYSFLQRPSEEQYPADNVTIDQYPDDFEPDMNTGEDEVSSGNSSGKEIESNGKEIESNINRELVCGLIDVQGKKIILKEKNNTVWELAPEDGASANLLEEREGVQTCIGYDPESEDQKDLKQMKIHVISAAVIHDAEEEVL